MDGCEENDLGADFPLGDEGGCPRLEIGDASEQNSWILRSYGAYSLVTNFKGGSGDGGVDINPSLRKWVLWLRSGTRIEF